MHRYGWSKRSSSSRSNLLAVIRPPPQEQQALENMVSRFKLVMDDLSALSRVSHTNIVRYDDVITRANKETHFPFSAVCILTEMCHGDVLNILNEMPVEPESTHLETDLRSVVLPAQRTPRPAHDCPSGHQTKEHPI